MVRTNLRNIDGGNAGRYPHLLCHCVGVAMNPTITVAQMASVLGLTLTAVREGIANNHYKAFAYCYGKGKKRTFVIDRFGFETYLARTGRSEEYIKEAFNHACIS